MNWKKLLCKERIRKSSVKTDDLRSEFEKDYHRIIGSASFRRLQDKTQVFPLDKSDFVRTRLTHSLEASSFGKSLGQGVGGIIIKNSIDKDFKTEYTSHICDILQSAGLIHDIGNPPFGHFGELAIRSWFKSNMAKIMYKGKPANKILNDTMLEDFYSFEGNAQGLRVVTKLHRIVDKHGMNLTKGLLSAIIKYPCSSVEANKKFGYFYAERDIFKDLNESCGTMGKRNPLVLLLEAADDIAYKTADIEDSFKKGIINFEELKGELGESGKDLQALYNGNGYNTVVRYLIAVQRDALNEAINCFAQNYSAIMNGSFCGSLLNYGSYGRLLDALGDIACRYAFNSRPIYLLELGGSSIINFLLSKFTAAVTDPKSNDGINNRIYSLISDNYKKCYEEYSKDKTEEEKLYLRLLLATDYISGMTDSFARQLYRELSGTGV